MRTDENMLFSKESLNSSIANVDREDDDKLVDFIYPTNEEDNSDIGMHLQQRQSEVMQASFANYSNGSIDVR